MAIRARRRDTTNPIIRDILPETVNSYEVGLKSSFFEHRLTVDAALFNEKFTNFQTTVLNTNITPAAQVLGNAGGERTRGAELEMTGKATEELTLGTGLTYLDAKFTDFRAPCYQKFAPIPEPVTLIANTPGACYTLPGTNTSFTQAGGVRSSTTPANGPSMPA